MDLERLAKHEGDRLIRWPHFDMESAQAVQAMCLRSPAHESYHIPSGSSIYIANKVLSSIAAFAHQFDAVNIIYQSPRCKPFIQKGITAPQKEGDEGIAEKLDEWMMKKHRRDKEYTITIVADPTASKDSFAGHLVSNGDMGIYAQLLSDREALREHDYTIDNPHSLEIVKDCDKKNKAVPEDVVDRLCRHYGRLEGCFEFIFGKADPLEDEQQRPEFYTIRYHPLG
ncbi:MAG: hypothetical protein ACOC32_00590 [Nanoarchaeota archaeon]